NGVGRIDHVENRLVGIKSREIYEAPAAVILHNAHRELEYLTLSRQALRFKTYVSQTCSDIIYDGLWYSSFHQDLMGFVEKNQRFVSGTVRVSLYKGNHTVTG
ncbi:MAG TPA: argininosuccinate synthase, partial [Planctomycetaceae bacterium]|nr:argininosuccinate synthase [Planctomycetaceae bacterium]